MARRLLVWGTVLMLLCGMCMTGFAASAADDGLFLRILSGAQTENADGTVSVTLYVETPGDLITTNGGFSLFYDVDALALVGGVDYTGSFFSNKVSETDISLVYANRDLAGEIRLSFASGFGYVQTERDVMMTLTFRRLKTAETDSVVRPEVRKWECYHKGDSPVNVNQNLAGQVQLLELTERTDVIYAPVFYMALSPGLPLDDLFGTGAIDSSCARLVLQREVGLVALTPRQERAADVSGDKQIDSSDARLILQYEVKLISAFPAAG